MQEPPPQFASRPESTPPKCHTCGYDLTGLCVEDRCPECGGPVWVDVGERADALARVYASAESSFYAACLAVVLGIGCGPFGLLVGLWAIYLCITAIRERHQNRGPSRNMPFVSIVVAGVAVAISLAWILSFLV